MVRTKAGSAAVRKGMQGHYLLDIRIHLFPPIQLLLLKLQERACPLLVHPFRPLVEAGWAKRRLKTAEATRSRCGLPRNGNRTFTRSWVLSSRGAAAVPARLVKVLLALTPQMRWRQKSRSWLEPVLVAVAAVKTQSKAPPPLTKLQDLNYWVEILPSWIVTVKMTSNKLSHYYNNYYSSWHVHMRMYTSPYTRVISSTHLPLTLLTIVTSVRRFE